MTQEKQVRCDVCDLLRSPDLVQDGKCESCSEADETIEYDGVEMTCGNEDCDNPHLEHDRFWSDGPSRHHWFKCRNCDASMCFHSNHKDEITSSSTMKVVSDPEGKLA